MRRYFKTSFYIGLAVASATPCVVAAATAPGAQKPDDGRPPYLMQRVHQEEGVVNAPASALWALITEWGGLMKWWVAVPGEPKAPILSCDLLPGQTEKDIPRTRRCKFDPVKIKTVMVPPEIADPNFVIPDYLDEPLLSVDDKSRYLVYKYSDNFHPGSTTIQVVEEGPCRARFIIKYTNLEMSNDVHAAAARAKEGQIGDAFGKDADYRGMKYYLEKQWTGRAPCAG